MRRSVVAAVLLASVAVVSGARAAPGASAPRVGPHFRVLCRFVDDAAADAALETAEAVWPLAAELYGLPPGPLDTPLDVHLFRDAASYLAEERALAGGAFDKNLAFSSYETKSAYVAVQPDLADETLAAVGLTAQTRHLIAHEAAHLVRWRAHANFRSHPGWVSDGAAIWIEEETLAARGWSAPGGEDPYCASDMIRAQRLLKGGALPGVARVLHDDVRDMDMYDRYSVRKLLFRRLMTRKDAPAFRAALAEALRLEEGADFARRFFEVVVRPYATEGLEGLDLDFEQFVRSQTPAWDEVHRALSSGGDAWTQTAFADANAVAWRTAPVGAEAYEVRGQLEILPGTGTARQMNVLLARGEDGFVSVAFLAGHGVDVFRYHRAEDRWEKLASASTKAVQLWRRLPFRVAVDGSKLTVRVDGTELVCVEAPEHAMSGPWGLGVQAGGAGVWRGIKVEPPKK
jgi:hypothetical protein